MNETPQPPIPPTSLADASASSNGNGWNPRRGTERIPQGHAPAPPPDFAPGPATDVSSIADLRTSTGEGTLVSPIGPGQTHHPIVGSDRIYETPIQSYLRRLHEALRDEKGGEVASYIPELAKQNPDLFGICLVTSDGHVYEVGDVDHEFTIQSISKPFLYGLALEDKGVAGVLEKVGVEPTGDAFNSISLQPRTGRPFNPMINAGAIATTSLIEGRDVFERLSRITNMFSGYAGRELTYDIEVFESENKTGHRNRAISYMLRNFDILGDRVDEDLELYFRACSISLTCRDLATMGATMANGGVNPVTNARCVDIRYVEKMLSVMTMCGMYDYAGEWVYSVGLPAKSGVGGGIIAVLPGQLGIGVFSPPLDARGNSVRGIKVCQEISNYFSLHLFKTPITTESVIRRTYQVGEVFSRRKRDVESTTVLIENGYRAKVYEAIGDLQFATTEVILRRVTEDLPHTQYVLFDFKRVDQIDGAAIRLLLDLLRTCQDDQKRILFSHVDLDEPRWQAFQAYDPTRALQGATFFPSTDAALEWLEDQVLAHAGSTPKAARTVALREMELLAGLSESELDVIEALTDLVEYPAGQQIIRRGAPADGIYMIATGGVYARATMERGAHRRLTTFSPGMIFGESGVIARGENTFDIWADEATSCYRISAETFHRLTVDQPTIKSKLLESLCREVAMKLAIANNELASLDY